MATTSKVSGFKELLAALQSLPVAVGDKAAMGALLAAGQPMKREARARAPRLKTAKGNRKAGTIAKNIVLQRSRVNKGQRGLYEVILRVKPLSKTQRRAFKSAGAAGKDNPDDPFYWWHQEFGTRHHGPKPFLRPAFESNKAAMIAILGEKMWDKIVKQARKMNRGR